MVTSSSSSFLHTLSFLHVVFLHECTRACGGRTLRSAWFWHIGKYTGVSYFLEAVTSALKLFKVLHVFCAYPRLRKPALSAVTHDTHNARIPFRGCLTITSVVAEKEVCRLEITGDQLLFSCGPKHLRNLVNISKYPAKQMNTFFPPFTNLALTGHPKPVQVSSEFLICCRKEPWSEYAI